MDGTGDHGVQVNMGRIARKDGYIVLYGFFSALKCWFLVYILMQLYGGGNIDVVAKPLFEGIIL